MNTPLPLSTITMEAIGKIVDKWRKSEINSYDAIGKIGAIVIEYQKVDWELNH